jgi:hypothetical protein
MVRFMELAAKTAKSGYPTVCLIQHECGPDQRPGRVGGRHVRPGCGRAGKQVQHRIANRPAV